MTECKRCSEWKNSDGRPISSRIGQRQLLSFLQKTGHPRIRRYVMFSESQRRRGRLWVPWRIRYWRALVIRRMFWLYRNPSHRIVTTSGENSFSISQDMANTFCYLSLHPSRPSYLKKEMTVFEISILWQIRLLSMSEGQCWWQTQRRWGNRLFPNLLGFPPWKETSEWVPLSPATQIGMWDLDVWIARWGFLSSEYLLESCSKFAGNFGIRI